MKLRVFYADKGDCLLLTSDRKDNILIDGGPKRKTFVARTIPTLQRLADAGQRIDLVLVSHIDQDHITGVIELVDRFIAWRQHDFDIDPDGGNQPGAPEPTFDRPPEILQMWHNSWKQHLGGLASKVSAVVNQVAATAADPAATDSEVEAVEALSSLAESIGEASKLQDLVDTVPSPIARNKGFAEGLVTLTDPPVTKKVGSLGLTLLGPSDEQLESLREFWRKALHLPKTVAGPGLNVGGAALAVDEFDLAAAIDVEQTAVDLVESVAADFAANIATGTIGDIGPVTEANRASIIVLAEEGRRKKKDHRSCLLTGDATHVDIVGGLEAAGLLDGGVFWCDIHKFQHHGSEHNADEEFASTVLAKHYVFSANGEHDNPDPLIVELLIKGRAEKASDVPFTVWFTCSVKEAEPKFQPKVREALNAAVDAAADANAATKGLVTIRVLTPGKPFFDICLCLPDADCDCASPSSQTTKLTKRIPDDG